MDLDADAVPTVVEVFAVAGSAVPAFADVHDGAKDLVTGIATGVGCRGSGGNGDRADGEAKCNEQDEFGAHGMPHTRRPIDPFGYATVALQISMG